jgi:predicted nucleic acid-binding protein
LSLITVGLLLAAKLRGELAELRPVLDQLTSQGFRISAQLAAEVLKAANEA